MTARPADAESVDVLIAEDDLLMRRSLRTFLEGEGYVCSEAGDGQAAVDLALRRPPRCAILDLAMPVLDGFAVARALRSDPRTRGIHLHCLTGLSDPSALQRAADAGIETYLTKPLDPSRLLRIVEEQVRRPDAVRVSGLTLDQARAQLDAWEAAGYGALEAAYREGSGFTVRGVRPAASLRAG